MMNFDNELRFLEDQLGKIWRVRRKSLSIYRMLRDSVLFILLLIEEIMKS